MSFRSCCLCFAVLAPLGAGGASPATADPFPVAGTAGLTLSSELVSSIPINLGDTPICGLDPQSGYLATCLAVVKPGGLELELSEGNAVPGGLQLLSAEPLQTDCGLWQVMVELDPTRTQPPSPMIFEGDSADPGSGLFAGVLKMETRLHFTNLETGQTADFPLSLGLSLAGPWTLAPGEAGEAGTRPLLFTRRGPNETIVFEECFPFWVFGNSKYIVDENSGCQMCPLPIMPAGNSSSDHGFIPE